MPRCGCGDECNCLLQEQTGIDITGTGAPNNPYSIAFNGGEVIANGLAWDPSVRKLSTRLAAGGGLEFDGAGAMRATGTSTGGGPGWTTIADLETRTYPLVIGHTGSGFFIKPETLIRSYQYGQQIGLDAMHVPVRFLSDGTPVVHSDEVMGRVSGEPWNAAAWTSQHVQDFDGHRWGIVPMMAGLDNPYLRNQPDGNTEPTTEFNATAWANAKWQDRSPSFGTFGYRERPQYGCTFLADVFREVGGRTPLVLDIRFPARDATTGAFVKATPAWRTDLFLRNVLSMIQRFGLTNYVVVISTEITIPAQAAGQTVNVLSYFSSAGVRVGPVINSTNLAAWTPANWPATWTWAFFHNTLTDAQILPYKAITIGGKAIRCILLQLQRQTNWTTRVTGPGLAGATSNDPVYSAGLAVAGSNHPLSGLGYRRNWPRWQDAVVDHGTIPPNETPQRATPWFRGIKQPGPDMTLYGPQMVPNTAGTTYYVLQGWGCPLAIPTDISFDFTIQLDQFESPRSQAAWMAFSFCRNTDALFSDWNPAPGANVDAMSGYTFMLTHRDTAADAVNPNIYLYGYQAGAVVTLGTARTLTPVAAGSGKRFRIGINFRGLRISAVQADGSLVTLIENRTDLAKAYRGAYFHLGRFSQGNQAWYGIFSTFTYTSLAGAADGPQ